MGVSENRLIIKSATNNDSFYFALCNLVHSTGTCTRALYTGTGTCLLSTWYKTGALQEIAPRFCSALSWTRLQPLERFRVSDWSQDHIKSFRVMEDVMLTILFFSESLLDTRCL